MSAAAAPAPTRSAKNIEIVRSAVDAWNRGDHEAWIEWFAPDSEFRPLRAQLEAHAYEGHDGLHRFIADLAEDWEQVRFVAAGELRAGGDQVVGLFRFQGRGRASGVEIDVPVGIVAGIRHGEIARLQMFSDPAEALELAAVGDPAADSEDTLHAAILSRPGSGVGCSPDVTRHGAPDTRIDLGVDSRRGLKEEPHGAAQPADGMGTEPDRGLGGQPGRSGGARWRRDGLDGEWVEHDAVHVERAGRRFVRSRHPGWDLRGHDHRGGRAGRQRTHAGRDGWRCWGVGVGQFRR